MSYLRLLCIFYLTKQETACAKQGYWKDNNTIACYDTYDVKSPVYTDTSVNNTVNRQWMWYLCNEP